LHSIWQGAALAVVYALLRPVLRRYSANVRYIFACATLLGTAVAPIITFLHLTLEAVTAPQSAFGVLGSGFHARTYNLRFDSAPTWTFTNWNRFLDPIAPWLVMAWGMGVMLLSVRWLHGYSRVRLLRTVQTASLDGVWLEALQDLKHRFNVSRRVRLVSSALAEVPMIIGWLRPVILLPVSTLTGLTQAQVVAILAHELAHVRRCDYLVNAFQNVVETILFYHPAIWWISRCIRDEREECCDDMVVRICGDRFGYARALFRLEELRGAPPCLAFAASGGSLLGRIRRLVAGKPGPITVRESCGLALIGVGILLLGAGCFLMLGPRTYCSTVRVKIEHRYAVPSPAINGERSGFFSDPYFIQTEFEVIQSEVILGKVIEDLDLDKHWSRTFGRVLKRPESVELLKRQMDIRPVRNTSIIELRIYDENPTRAAEIANKIADTYRDWRTQQGSRQAGDHLDSLLGQVKDQEAAIAAAQATVDELRMQVIVQGTGDAQNAVQPRISAETLRKVEGLRIESQAEYVRSKVLLDSLRNLGADQLVQAIPATGIQDQLLTDLVSQRVLAGQKLAALKTDYGPEHTEVRRVSAQIAELDQKITERTRGFLAGLSARVDSLAQGLNDLSNEVTKATQLDLKDIAQFSDRETAYARAKRELDDQIEIRKILVLKLASEKTEPPPPKSSTVEIVDPAFPTSWPATPNRPRAITLMVSGTVLGLFGFLLARTQRSSVAITPQLS
jgi:uncharacterized protein involved in exopolysaccharide biosynthesis/beta-lactamase regulating signal transducer with metallopeptidase domain